MCFLASNVAMWQQTEKQQSTSSKRRFFYFFFCECVFLYEWRGVGVYVLQKCVDDKEGNVGDDYVKDSKDCLRRSWEWVRNNTRMRLKIGSNYIKFSSSISQQIDFNFDSWQMHEGKIGNII
jgi:hypothetical protein